MVKEREKKSTWDIVFSRKLLLVILALMLYVLICSHVIWFVERGGGDFDRRWPHGALQGVWWTIVTMSTVGYGDFVLRKAISRILAVFIIFSGIVLFGAAIAAFTSVLTVENLKTDIASHRDLVGQKVAVLNNTYTERVIQKMGAQIYKMETMAQAATVLQQGKVKAWVHDMPLLQYYLRNQNPKKLVLTGGFFAPSNYGITFPEGSPLRKPLNIALLKMLEDEYSPHRQLRQKWFGVESYLEFY